MSARTIMKAWYSLLLMLLACNLLYAASETVNGVTYTYSIANGEAMIGTDEYESAIPTSTSGVIEIPSTLGGCPVTTIGQYAFENCKSLTSITIPESVREIRDSAFYGCSSLTSITIPNSVTTIDWSAFGWCDSLSEVTLPGRFVASQIFPTYENISSIRVAEGTTSIAEFAFSDCSSLVSLTIPEGVTTIGYCAFDNCTSLQSVTIPASVASIRPYLFFGCSSLVSINVAEGNISYCSVDGILYSKDRKTLVVCPAAKSAVTILDGVTTIAECAFQDCTSLASIAIPDSVTTIEYNAFAGCGALHSVTLPEGLKVIEDGVFTECMSLRSVMIPASVTTIGPYPFYDCSSLVSINVAEGNTSYCSVDGVLYSKNMKELVCCPGAKTSVSIPNGVTTIIREAFGECSMLTSVTIPDTVTTIDMGAFSGCSSLRAITIPNGVKEIAGATFYGCSSLTSVTIPNSVTTIRYDAFSGCSALTSAAIPSSVTRIENGAFFGCNALTSVTIPSSITKIGMSVFSGCSSLTSVTIPESVIEIGDDAFAGCTSLQTVTLPKGLTGIGYGTFSGCSSLKSITIPDRVTAIGDNAFDGCTSLELVTIPDSVTEIGWRAFYKCESLKEVIGWRPGLVSKEQLERIVVSGRVTEIGECAFKHNRSLTYITIPGSVIKIGDFAFSNCESLQSVTLAEGLTTIGHDAFQFCGSLTSITIPNSVTTIGCYAFEGCSSLASVTIPESVTEIGDRAFYECASLQSITIPNSVTEIGEYAFLGCSSLASITILDGVKTIGEGAFYDCSSLVSVVIPESVSEIGNHAFKGCYSLQTVTIPDSVTTIGEDAFPFYGIKEVIGWRPGLVWNKNLERIVVSGNVTEIDDWAFYGCKSLISIVIPNSVTEIGENAFHLCSSLASITIPNSVTEIGENAFLGCNSLTSVMIPGRFQLSKVFPFAYYNISSVVVSDGETTIVERAFNGCSSLTSITIPHSVTMIGVEAFYGTPFYENQPDGFVILGEGCLYHYKGVCPSDVTIPDCVTTIAGGAFSDCDSLQSVILPKGLREIGYGAFYGCSSLQAVLLPEGLTAIGSYAFYGCSSLTSVTIPDSVTTIGDYAFSECSALTSVTIPSSVTYIGYGAFEGCSSLASITIPDSVMEIGGVLFYGCESLKEVIGWRPGLGWLGDVERIVVSSQVTEIDEQAFWGWGSLKSITMPDCVTSIGDYAFYGCSSLASITIPDSVTAIGVGAFYDCSSLTTITIPDSVTMIGNSAFSGCSSLTSVTIPDSVTIIGEYAFYNCSSLTSITIPDSVTTIGDHAFSSCSSLASITIPDSVTAIGVGAFSGCSSLTSITIPEGVMDIGVGAFQDCSSLTSVTIPDSVTEIGDYAFSECSALMSVTIPSSVTYIGYGAFNGCESLEEVIGWRPGLGWLGDVERIVVSSQVTEIDEQAFWGWGSLKSITMPDSVTSIGDYAFCWCTSLTSITISDRVTSIGDYAFSGCSSLASIVIPESVTEIGYGAFSDCDLLETVVCVDKNDIERVKELMRDAGMDVDALAFIVLEDGFDVDNNGTLIRYVGSAPEELVIPEEVTKITSGAFRDQVELKTITIPSNVNEIAPNAFVGCDNLVTVYVDGGDINRVLGLLQASGASVSKIKFIDSDGVILEPISLVSITAQQRYPWNGKVDIEVQLADPLERFSNYVADIAVWDVLKMKKLEVSNILKVGEYITNGTTLSQRFLWDAEADLGAVKIDTIALTVPSAAAQDDAGSAMFALDCRTGVRFAQGTERIAFSPDWEVTADRAEAIVTVNGEELVRSTKSGVYEWSSEGIDDGRYDLTHRIVDNEGKTIKMDYATFIVNHKVKLHNGLLAESERWGCDSVHIVADDVSVPSGFALTIEPGAVVKFMPGVKLRVEKGGYCVAYGAIFTHIADDSAGGDTLFDGEETLPVMDDYEITGSVMEDETTEYRYLNSVPVVLEGMISSDARWCGWKTYHVTGNLTIASGVTLTVEPGCVVKFDSGLGITVDSGATLKALGTRNRPIVFTSIKDDEHGGDTNGDGDTTKPEGGNWQGLYVYGTADLAYCAAMYAAPYNETGNIECEYGARLTMNGCTVAHSLYDGVWNWGGTIKITNSVFIDCGNAVCPYQGDTECINCVMAYGNFGYMDWSHWNGGTFMNCIFYGMGINWSDTDDAAEFQSHSMVKNCCFFNPEGYAKRSCTKDGVDGCRYVDPKFFDPDNGDFRIAADSPCVDAGDGTVAPEFDYYGQPRMDVKGMSSAGVPNAEGLCPDIGIYEVLGKVTGPVADLAVISVTASATAVSSEELEITYVVTNRSMRTATGMVRDRIALRGAEASLGGQTVAAGEVQQFYSLTAGATAEFVEKVKCPAVKSGNWSVGVTVNAERDIFEQVTANNTGWASASTTIELPVLPTGENPISVVAGSTKGFVVGEEVRTLRVTSTAALDKVVVYGATGAVPQSAEDGIQAILLGDGSWLLVLPETTTDAKGYVVIENAGAANVALKVTAQDDKLAVYSIAPSRVAAVDNVSVTITGTGLAGNQAVTLGGRMATHVTKLNTAQIVATFDLKGMVVGEASVEVQGEGVVVSRSSVEVYKTTQGPKLEAKLVLPNAVRDGRIYTAWVEYANAGDEPMAMPIFKVERNDSSTLIGLTTDVSKMQTKVFVGGIAPNHPAGVLQPGDSGRLPVFFVPSGTYGLKLSHTKETDNTEQFAAFGGVKPYLAAMSAAATRLNLRGRTEFSAHEFVDQALWEKNGVACAAVSGWLRDTLTRTPIANAEIALVSTNENARVSFGATTDASGYFQIRNVPDGDFRWSSVDVNEFVSSDVVSVSDQVDLNGVEVLARAAGRVSGFVYVEDGMAAEGVAVAVSDELGTLVGWSATDASGVFEIKHVPDGVYTIRVAPTGVWQGVVETNVVVSTSMPNVDKEYVLSCGGCVRGVVRDPEGCLVTNGVVQAITPDGVTYEAICETNGYYIISGLSPSAYAVRYYSSVRISSDEDVVIGAGDEAVCNLEAVPRPLFVSTRTVGFGSLETRFIFTDVERAKNVTLWKWDFDSDGVVDSQEAEPTWTYAQPGTNTVTLVIVENGRETTSVYPACVRVEKEIETILNDNAIVFGLNSGSLVVDDVSDMTLTLSGRPHSGEISTGTVLLGQYGDGWFCRRVVSVVDNANDRMLLQTTKADWEDVYEQCGIAFSSEVTEARSPMPRNAPRMKLSALEDDGFRVMAEGGVTVKVGCKPDVRIEVVRQKLNGRKYFKWAIVGKMTVEGAVNAEGSITAQWRKSLDLPMEIILPTGIPGVTAHGSGAFYAEVGAKGSGSFGASGELTAFLQIGQQAYDNEDLKWLPPFNFQKDGTMQGDLEGSVYAKFGFVPKFSVKFLETLSAVLEPDAYIQAEAKCSAMAPAEGSLAIGVDMAGEANLVDWKVGWFELKLGVSGTLEGPRRQLLGWRGPSPDFEWNPTSNLKAPVTVNFINHSEGEKITVGWVDVVKEPQKFEWEFGQNFCSVEEVAVNPRMTYAEDGRYNVYLRALGTHLNGPYRKKNTVVIGKEAQEDDGEDQPDDNDGGSPVQSCDPNEMAGPLGTGDSETQRFVKPGEWMDYTIYFENKKDADVPAQEVFVDAQLSEYLDWSTFEMGEVAFNNQNETVLAGVKNGQKTVAQNGADYKVRLSVAFDVTTGAAHWYLRSYDPGRSEYNYWPAAVDAGFLPPNDETHRGEGHLTYRVKVREDAPPGTRIDASATIVFDQNEPIETDPAWWNTVHAGGTAAFAAAGVTVDEGGMLKIAVNGGRMDLASRVQVQVAYNTAAAADLDLKNAAVNGVPVKSFKFPVTLDWAAGEVGEKTIEIPVPVDKAVEVDEFLTLELVNPMNLKIEGAACTVTIRDPQYAELKAKVADGTATKAETNDLQKIEKALAGKAYVRGLANDATRGKVTGSALAADGKTVNLKAAANKGWVFAGWYTDAACSVGHELAGYGDYRDPSLAYVNTNGTTTVYARFVTPDEDALSLGADFLPAAFTVGENVSIEIPVESVSLPTITIAGLPSGLKYYAKETTVKATKTTPAYTIPANTIYGTVIAKPTTKPLSITVTVKNLGGYQIVRKYEASVVAASPEPSSAHVLSDAAPFRSISVTRSDDFAGTVAGAGVYQTGKKVTLKATPTKGYVFAGWYDGEGAVATQVANWSFEMPDADLALEARFVTAEEDKASVTVGVNGMAFSLTDGQEIASPLSTNVMCGVALRWSLNVESLALPTIAVSGLPSGLKFTAKDVVDSKTKQVLVPANTIYGTPTAASKTDKNGTVVPSLVKVQLTTAGKYKLLFPMEIVVDPLPDWAVGTFNGSEGGLLTLTVAANGKISGKLAKDGLAWTLAAPAFGMYESATETYAAEVTATAGKASETWPLTLVGETAGETVYGLADLNGDMAYQNLWKLEPWKSEGKLWAARPPAVFTSEDEVGLLPGESVTLKFAASGAVSAAGVFANGYKATCSTVLIPYDSSPVAFVYFPPNEKKGFRGYSACLAIGGE